jgi:aspartyl/asparaginyl-tRNA synthetase
MGQTSQPRWHDLNQFDYLTTGIGEGTAGAERQAQNERVEETMLDNNAEILDGVRKSRDFAPNQIRVRR